MIDPADPKVDCPACLGRAAGRDEVFPCGEIVCGLCHGEGCLTPSMTDCPRCDGEGAITCPVCDGEGAITQQRAAGYLLVGLPEVEP